MFKRMMKIALGSEVDKSYVVEEKPVATGGPHFCWRVHNAVRRSTNEEVSVFYFKESYLTPEDKQYRSDFFYLLHQDVKKMTMLRHPYTLKVIEVMPENPKEIVFVTERVLCSLANRCNDLTNIPAELVQKCKHEHPLSQFEVTCGLIHVSDALVFMHDTAKMVHLDLSPQNIWITPDGSWKLAGFGFSLSPDTGSTRYLLDCGTIPAARYAAVPDMNYSAPELSTQPGNFGCTADLWSLGCLIWELFSLGIEANGTTHKLINVEDGNPLTHAYKVQNLGAISFERIPEMLQPCLRNLLSVNPDYRQTAAAVKNCSYFSHGPVQTMRQLENLLQMDEESQKGVLKNLQASLTDFPVNILESMVIPKLAEVANISEFAIYLLPCLLFIGGKVDSTIFNKKLVPALIPTITITSPAELVTQLYLIFLKQIDMIFEKADKEFKNKYVVTIMGHSLSSGNKQLQFPVLKSMDKVWSQCDKNRVKEVVIPKIQKVILGDGDAEVRVNAINCLCDHLDAFSNSEIQSEILNTYKKLLAEERNPELMVAVTHCYSIIGKKFGVAVIAQTILPKVTYLLAEKSLDGVQYNAMLADIEDMLQTITSLRQAEFAKKAEEKEKQEAERQRQEAERLKNEAAKAAAGDMFGGMDNKPANGDDMFGGMDGNTGGGDDMFGGMDNKAGGGDMFGDMGSQLPKASNDMGGGDMFGGMDAPSSQPANDLGGMSMGGDMFGGMDNKPESKPANDFGGMSMGGDMFGGMDSQSSQPANDIGGMSMGGDMFGGMDNKPESKPANDFGGMSMGGDMFGGMDSKPEPKPSKPANDFGGMSMGGDMFGGMDNKPESKPEEPANDFGGMSMGGDMFGGMDNKPEAQPANEISGMSMGGDMFGGMDPLASKPANDFGGMSMGGDMFGGMDNKPESKSANEISGISMGGDMFGGMDSQSSQPANDIGGMSMGGDMFGGMDNKPESKPANDFGGMSMGGDMFGGMDPLASKPAQPSKPANDFGGMSMGGDMFGGMDNKPEPKPSKPANDFGGMSMGGDMFGGMDNKPESKPANDFGGMSMGGDMFGDMDPLASKPAPKPSKPANDFGGMSMGGDMFGGMDNKPESKPANDFGGMSMGGDMFGGMDPLASKPAQPSKPANDFGGMSMGGDMFGDMDSQPSKPSNNISGMSMGGDMFSGMSMGGDMFGAMDSQPPKSSSNNTSSASAGGDMFGGMSMGGDMFSGMF